MTAQVAATDRLNPVLVKEVRAALRARVFRILFQVVIAGSVLVALGALMEFEDNPLLHNPGQQLFLPVFMCLTTTLLFVVPLSAFFAMSREWEENTYDLLALSNLRPRQIVLGKLVASCIEGLLYFSAFAPMLVIAFLSRGIDIRFVAIMLAGTYAASIASSAVAIGMSTLARGRVMRVLLLMVLAAAAFGLVAGFVEAAEGGLRRAVWTTVFDDEIVALIALSVGLGVLGFAVACERLAHPEENHSTGPRIAVTLLLAAVLVWMVVETNGYTVHTLYQPLGVILAFLTVAHIFFVTENDTLSRRVGRSVPRGSWLAFLSTPFLPGGVRALVLFGVHVVMGLVAGAIASGPGTSFGSEYDAWFPGSPRYFVFAGYMFLYLALGSALFARKAPIPLSRWFARIALLTVIVASILLPAILNFLFNPRRVLDMDHVLNPFVLLDDETRPVVVARMARVMVGLTVLVALLQLKRLDRAVREVVRLSRENRARSGRAA